MREPPLSTATEILVRTAFGMLSDITWRVQAGLAKRNERGPEVREAGANPVPILVSLTVATIPVMLGLAVIGGLGADGPLGREVFGTLVPLTGIAMLAGLVLSNRVPLIGLSSLALGVIAISVMLFWMAFITLPAGIALLATAYSRARATGWPHGTGTA
jgi:hypothetical protein